MSAEDQALPRKLRWALEEHALGSRAVLDLACGPGRHLAHFGPGSLGLDRDARALGPARAAGLRVADVDLQRAGWSNEPELRAAAPFEAAWLCDCLVHLPHPEIALAELPGLLAPGAPVLVVEWCLPEGPLAGALARRFPGAAAHFAHPEHLHAWSEDRWVQLLELAGLEHEATALHGLSPLLRRLPGPLLGAIPPRTLVARAPRLP